MLPPLSAGSLLRCRTCLSLGKVFSKSSHNSQTRGLSYSQTRGLSYSQTRGLSYSPNADCHYKVLDVNKDASQAEIKAAFVKKSKEVHPDMNPNDPTTHARFVRLNEAYTVLGRATSRREYDFSLSSRLAYHQALRQHQGTHSADSSHMPGAGTYHGGHADRPFWDETIFEMRDKRKDGDRFYQEDMFYGVKGVRRVSNSYIVVGCFILMGMGVMLHLAAIQYSSRIGRAFLDERDKKANAHLENARRRARQHGNAKQLELLKQQMEAHQVQNGIRPPPS